MEYTDPQRDSYGFAARINKLSFGIAWGDSLLLSAITSGLVAAVEYCPYCTRYRSWRTFFELDGWRRAGFAATHRFRQCFIGPPIFDSACEHCLSLPRCP